MEILLSVSGPCEIKETFLLGMGISKGSMRVYLHRYPVSQSYLGYLIDTVGRARDPDSLGYVDPDPKVYNKGKSRV